MIFLEKNEADAASRQAQVLWSACQALLRAIKAGCPGLPWKDQMRPLTPEIQAVEYAAGVWTLSILFYFCLFQYICKFELPYFLVYYCISLNIQFAVTELVVCVLF